MEREKLSKVECRAVERHWRHLAQVWRPDVTYEEALEDWLANHAEAWRVRRQERALEKQRQEMLKHKWIESEKARCDIGKQAYIDWIKRYAADWRRWYEETEEEDSACS